MDVSQVSLYVHALLVSPYTASCPSEPSMGAKQHAPQLMGVHLLADLVQFMLEFIHGR
jgi:hypothetical protein